MAEPALTAAPLVGDQEQQQQSQSPAHQQQQAAAGQRLVGRWALSTHIGAGSFAIVWRARHVDTGAEAAVKEINLSKLNSKLRQSLESEVSILKRVRHENIVTLLEVVEEEGRLFLVMEYCAGGDLAHFLRRVKRVPEAVARHFMRQLAAGLREMWAHHLVHRDLKPQNLLLSVAAPSATLKIADFGFARNLQPQGLAETLCGSPLYMAPEILHFHKYDAKADLWSIGAILFELVVGRPPFTGANQFQLLRCIERNEARVPEGISAQLSPPCRHLIHCLLRRNPVERLSFEEFFRHPFVATPAWLSGARWRRLQRVGRVLQDVAAARQAAPGGAPLEHAQLRQCLSLHLAALQLLEHALEAHSAAVAAAAAADERGSISEQPEDSEDAAALAAAAAELQQEAGDSMAAAEAAAAALAKAGREPSPTTVTPAAAAAAEAEAALPDPWELLYSAALGWGREAAVDELLGSQRRSAALYERAGVALGFLSGEAAELELEPPVELAPADRTRLRKYAAATAARWAACCAPAAGAAAGSGEVTAVPQ